MKLYTSIFYCMRIPNCRSLFPFLGGMVAEYQYFHFQIFGKVQR